jgi:phage baseplate assembly protein V
VRDVLRRLLGIVRRARVSLVDDTQPMQEVQITALADDVLFSERFQSYGFTGVPLLGAEAIVLFVGAARNHPVVVAVDDRRYRMANLQPGEVAIYTDQGDYVVIRRGGAMELKAAAGVTITSPSVHLTGSLTVDGDADVKGNANIEGSSGVTVPNGDVVAGAIDLKHHTHTGVTSGGSQTGPPI